MSKRPATVLVVGATGSIGRLVVAEALREGYAVLLQGDTRQAGDPGDGVVARGQIAEVLVRSLASSAAERKTFELVAEHGPAPEDIDALFAALDADPPGALDAVHDTLNMPPEQEPAQVREDLQRLNAR